jgi:hypothetical protein
VAWFGDGDDACLRAAPGGGSVNPDWHVKLTARPGRASMNSPATHPSRSPPRR